jgi:uracil-DNA glycosylase
MEVKEYVTKYNNIINDCEFCNYSELIRGGVYLNNKDAKYLDVIFIGQNPGKSNFKENIKHASDIIPFGVNKESNYNKFFFYLKDMFEKKFDTWINYYITNIVKCATEDNKVDANLIERCTKHFLLDELISLDSALNRNYVLVALGKIAKETTEANKSIPLKHCFYNLDLPHLTVMGYNNTHRKCAERLMAVIGRMYEAL